ncbi:MAG TPA: hypothetical protein VH374_21040 [Polyangia bacterium]|nr:hypothetical protein [Polyangia bacterium]
MLKTSGLLFLALAAASLSACNTSSAINGDGSVEVPLRGAVDLGRDTTGDVDADASAVVDQSADEAAPDAGAATDAIVAPDTVATDSGGTDGVTTDATPPGETCRTEPVYTGPMLIFAGGPNFGAGDGVGLCGYPNDKLPKGKFFGAVDTALFANAQTCGACMRLENADATVTAEVQIIDLVDPLLPLADGHVLSVDKAVSDLFGAGGNPVVKYRVVPCDVSGNIQVQLDSTTIQGSSVLVMNQRTVVSAVQIQTVDGWRALTRTPFNRWAVPFAISGKSNTIRFTDTSERSVDAPAVPFVDGLQDTGVQLPPCL